MAATAPWLEERCCAVYATAAVLGWCSATALFAAAYNGDVHWLWAALAGNLALVGALGAKGLVLRCAERSPARQNWVLGAAAVFGLTAGPMCLAYLVLFGNDSNTTSVLGAAAFLLHLGITGARLLANAVATDAPAISLEDDNHDAEKAALHTHMLSVPGDQFWLRLSK